MENKPVKVYLDLLSQPCRALLIFLKHNKIPHKVHTVALRRGEQKSEEFTRINPMQKVPVIEHNGFILTESDAILKYLATVFNVPEHWYPLHPQQRARVDEYMAWHHSNTRPHVAKVFIMEVLMPRMSGRAADPVKLQRAVEEMENTLVKLEEMFLKRQVFLCGDDISIADLLAVCEIMQHCPEIKERGGVLSFPSPTVT
ncbi:glutathione S-transferase theta-1-like isoform X2 [Hoplias malabaricus]|uniref:glutathione S-transferase theta-1-like isoform X2 n=1 Tax=Hoplias malabaricus TaxID=27720 RepID=UPI003461980E